MILKSPLKTVVFGSGQVGQMTARLLGSDYQLICFADNAPGHQGKLLEGIPICSPEEALSRRPEFLVLGVLDEERQSQMKAQLRELGYQGPILTPDALRSFDARCAVMRLLARQLYEEEIPGDVAELGVFRGEFSALINASFPDRRLHLFDTFEGFSEKDTEVETACVFSHAKPGDFSDTSLEAVLNRLPHPEKAIVHQGWFPETFPEGAGLRLAFVSIDADLYAPTKAALPLFYETLVPGGVLLIHDALSTQFGGCQKAVSEFCKEMHLLPCPVPDLHGSAVLRKPLPSTPSCVFRGPMT